MTALCTTDKRASPLLESGTLVKRTVRLWRDRLGARIAQPLDNRVWRFWSGDTEPYCIHRRLHVDAMSTYAPEVDVDELRRAEPEIYDYVMHRFAEYVYEFRLPLTIEPRRSWLIPQRFRVLEASFPMIHDPWDGTKPRPSTLGYVFRGQKARTFDRAISVSYAWNNYYHFFVDALPQLYLLDSLGIERSTPVVVPEQFATTKYVEDFRRLSTFLDGRTIVVQRPGEYIQVKVATYVAKDTFFSPALFHILDTLHPVGSERDGPARVYVRRDPSGPRALSNDREIAMIAERNGYHVVDTGRLPLREQIALFRGARTVVGVHGAGLTNVIFRRPHALQLLELTPAHLDSTHYRSLCIQFGFRYARLRGGAVDLQQHFGVDPAQFEQALQELNRSEESQARRNDGK